MIPLKNIFYTLLFCGLLYSCAVGPDYKKPTLDSSVSYRYATKSDSVINLKWWEIFNDSVLDQLIYTALKENKNVLIAASRIEQARENVGFTKASSRPKVNASVSAGRGNLTQGIQFADPTSAFGGSVGASWEIDFWGKYKRSTEAAKSDLLASFYGKRAIEIALISEVATNYFQLLDFRSRLEISESTLALRSSTLDIIQARFDKGYTHIIDVNQAQIQKAITEVSVPQFKRQIAYKEHNLSLLLGRTPDSFPTHRGLKEFELPKSIPPGIPSEILQRRPDILEAAQNYRSQNARIGVAEAMRFPSISLTGLLGASNSELSNLVSDGLGWSVGGSITAPLFEWGKNKRRADIEREVAKQSLLVYENTVLKSLLEVENSLVEIETLKEELLANERMLNASSNASSLSRERYYQGETSYLEVIENQRQEFEARLSYSANYRDLLNSHISLYKALGGGWISQAEMDKFAQQLADEKGVEVSEINKDSLFYSGQVVDLALTKEEEKARKEAKKQARKKERE